MMARSISSFLSSSKACGSFRASSAQLLILGFQCLISPVIGYGVYVLTGIRGELRTLNGRMIRMEQWKTDHEDSDNRRLAKLEARR